MATYEELDSVWDEVEDELAQRSLTVFPADLDPGDGPRAFWPDGPVSEFLDFVERLRAPLIFSCALRFEPDDADDLAQRLAPASSGSARDLQMEAERHIGDVYEIQLALAHGGATLLWIATAGWHEDLQARAEEEADSAAVVSSAERSLQEDAWIQTLARNVRFEHARTLDQRLRIAERVVPELEPMRTHPDPWVRATPRRIVRAAWDLYVELIQPEQDRSLARDAMALLASGARKYQVAGRLGISEDKLNRIVARYQDSADALPHAQAE